MYGICINKLTKKLKEGYSLLKTDADNQFKFRKINLYFVIDFFQNVEIGFNNKPIGVNLFFRNMFLCFFIFACSYYS